MKTSLSLSPAAQTETECLVAVALDRGEKDKTDVFVSTADKAVQQAAAALISAGDVSGKNFETHWLHNPSGLKAKRLLLVGGGKSAKFTAADLRKLAGAAVRALKPRKLRSLAFVLPDAIPAEDALRAVVEGSIVGDFDPDTYKSDRKDQRVESLTVVTSGDQSNFQRALDEAAVRLVGRGTSVTVRRARSSSPASASRSRSQEATVRASSGVREFRRARAPGASGAVP